MHCTYTLLMYLTIPEISDMLCAVFHWYLDGSDSRLEVVPKYVFKASSLKQAFWVQLLVLESPI
jgi:hypothetical protein